MEGGLDSRDRRETISSPPERDERLMLRYAQDDDKEAFEILFRRHASQIASLFERSGRTQSEALDLVQQTFLHLHRSRLDYDGERPFRPWLYAIAMNVGRTAWRNRRPTESTANLPEQEAPTAASSSTERAVRQALARIPEDQREVIVLHWYEGLTFVEVAEAVNSTLSAVKIKAHVGYRRLRELLGGEP
jgi:RNA polymerase sigma factor (sigma-70 family)